MLKSKIANCYLSQLNSPKKRRLNLKTFNSGIFIIILVLGTFYLINISDLTVKGFVLRELQTKSSFWASETRSNKEKIDALQSYHSLNSRAEDLNMVAVKNIEYLNPAQAVVAKR